MSYQRGMRTVASIRWFMLFWRVVNAVSLRNQSATTTLDDYQITYKASAFVDCSSYSTQSRASTTAIPVRSTSLPRAFNSTRVANHTLISFEEYWCAVVETSPANTPDSFPNNGSVVPHLFGLNASVKDHCLSLEKANYSSWAATASPSVLPSALQVSMVWNPTLTQPCCDTFCNIAAATAQLLYWPTPAPFPNATTVVGADGFTFTSPSVYVVYSGVSAYGRCGNVGPTYAHLTKSYLPSEISTFPGGGSGMGQRLNYADLFSNCTSTTVDTSMGAGGPPCETQGLSVETASACESQIKAYGSSYAFDQVHCYPELSFPPGLQSMDPAWARCDSDPYGGHFAFVFDPPHALTHRTALTPDPTKIPDTQLSASPAPLPSSPGPAQTPPPSSSPTASPPGNGPSKAGGDPSSGNPGNPGNPGNGNPSSGNPGNPGNPGNGNPSSGSPANSGNGNPSNGNGSPNSGKPGNPGNGSPSNGNPGNGSPSNGSPGNSNGNPSNGSPSNGSPGNSNSNPSNGNPSNGSPSNGSPGNSNGNPSNGNPSNGSPSNGSPGNSNGNPSNSSPGNGSPSNGGPGNGNGSPGNGSPSNSGPGNGNGSPSNGSPGISNGNPNNGSPSNGSPNNGNPSNGGPGNGSPRAGDPGKGGSTGSNGPANPNDMTPAQVSALHQALSPAPSANSQPPSAPQPNEATQPGADPKANAPPFSHASATNVGSSGPGSGNSNSGGENSGDPKVNNSNHGGSGDPNQPSPKAPVDGQSPATAPSFAIPNPVGPNLLGTVINSGSVVIGGITIGAGATAVQVSNHQVSLAPGASNIVVDGQSHVLPSNPQSIYTYTPAPASVFTVGNQAITLSSNKIVAAGSTLGANDAALTIAGTVVSLDSSVLHLGTSSIALIVPPPPTAAPRMITVAGQPATILPNGVAIAGTTLTPNAPAITVSGTPLSIGPGGLVIGTSTLPLPTLSPASVFTAAGQAVTAFSNGVVIAGSTLIPNAPAITVSGTPVSLGASGLVVGTSVIPLSTLPAVSVITAAGQSVTVLSNGVVIAGTTLKPNAPGVTIAGTPVSLGGNGLVVGTSTIAYQSIGSTSAGGIGGLVLSGLNGGVATPAVSGAGIANGTQVGTFKGSGSELRIPWSSLGITVALTGVFVGLDSAMW